MMQNEAIKTNYGKLAGVKQYNLDFSQKIVDKTVNSASQFSFMDLKQWILLLVLNTICFTFIVLACSLIRS